MGTEGRNRGRRPTRALHTGAHRLSPTTPCHVPTLGTPVLLSRSGGRANGQSWLHAAVHDRPAARSGRSGSLRARPAAQTPIEYGSDLVRSRSRGWPRYALVTSPMRRRPWGRLDTQPVGIVHATSLDFDELERLTVALPDDIALVVGAGGGQALDAAKHVAATKCVRLSKCRRSSPPERSCTATSPPSGDHVRSAGVTIGSGPTSDVVLVDHDLVLDAPTHLNTAGLGDIFCEYSGVAEVEARERSAPRPRSAAEELGRLLAFHRRVAQSFEATLHRGELTPFSIRCIVESLRERDSNRIHLSSAPQVDHHF